MGVEVAVASAILGAGTAAYGQYQAGQAAKAEGKFASKVADRNAKEAEMTAAAGQDNARTAARENRRRAEAITAENRAFLAEGGGAGGSLLALAGETAGQLEKDIQTAFGNDLIEADLWQKRATMERLEGQAAKARGKNAARAGTVGAGATLLTGAARTYGMGYDMGLWPKKQPAKPKMGSPGTGGYHQY
jgi:hypothetical protein